MPLLKSRPITMNQFVFSLCPASPGMDQRMPRRTRHRHVHAVALACAMLTCHAGTASAAAPAPSAAQAATFDIVGVRIEGNTLLPPPVLEAIAADLVGAGRSPADVRQSATRMQEAYRDAGFGGVLAFVPEQEITGGHVVIRVIEGQLARVRVTGNVHFDAANVRTGLPNLREGATPRVRAIDRDIQLANENPARQVKVTLKAGARLGDIDADIDVQDRPPMQWLFSYNNTGTPATGKHRLSAGFQHANVSGRDDVVTAQYQTSPSHPDRVQVLGAGYRLPLYAHAASVDLFYGYSNVSNGTTATPAGPLVFSGKGHVLGLRGNWHLERLGEYDHRVALGLDWRDYQNACALGDLGSAACGSAGVSLKVMPLVLSYTGQQQGTQVSWGVNASVSANVGGSSQAVFEAARPGAPKRYVVSRLTAFGDTALPGGFTLRGRLETQFSPDALVSGEKFGLGGAGSVRGYLERELSGDRGHAMRLELMGPAWGSENIQLRPIVFVDHGRVSNHQSMACGATAATVCSLTGTGLGVRMSAGRNLTASLDLARAHDPAASTAARDTRAHVAIQLAF